MRVVSWASMVALWLLGPARSVTAQEFEPEAVYKRAVRSCALLVATQKDRTTYGIGTLIDVEQRLVVTSARRLDGADTVSALFPLTGKDGTVVTDLKRYQKLAADGQALIGKVLHRDTTRDLALVQLDRLPPDTPAMPVARKSVRIGEHVVKVSTPHQVGVTFALRSGRVRRVASGDQFGLADGDPRRKLRLVQDTDPLGPAAGPGGPLVDPRGYLVAVVEAGEDSASTNLSLDVTEVRALLAEKKVAIKVPADETDGPAPKK